MLTPYDWQEGMGHRASYVESKLAQGAPVLAISIEEGILFYTFRRQARKVYEIYDRLIFSAIGQQSDVEAIRTAAVDFAHQEGYNRSEQDVTLQRVVTAISGAVKKAFADFSSSPVVAKSLFAEVNATPEQDQFAVLDYDGDYVTAKKFAFIALGEEVNQRLQTKLEELAKGKLNLERARKALEAIWTDARGEDSPSTEGLSVESVLLERSSARDNRFRLLEDA